MHLPSGGRAHHDFVHEVQPCAVSFESSHLSLGQKISVEEMRALVWCCSCSSVKKVVRIVIILPVA